MSNFTFYQNEYEETARSVASPYGNGKTLSFERFTKWGYTLAMDCADFPRGAPPDRPVGWTEENSGENPWIFTAAGASDVTRTHDLLITNQLLYRLSYTSKQI